MAVYCVTNTCDAGKGSLRQAVCAAQGQCGLSPMSTSTIRFCFPETPLQRIVIQLASEILIDQNVSLEIINDTPHRIVIKPTERNHKAIRLFHIASKAKVAFRGGLGRITLREGGARGSALAGCGGAILCSNFEGSLELSGVSLKRNYANFGGAIFSYGVLRIQEARTVQNHALYQGGAIWCKGAIVKKAIFNENTVLNTSTSAAGGAIYVDKGDFIHSGCQFNRNDMADESKNNTGGGAGAIAVMQGSLIGVGSQMNGNSACNYAALQVASGDVELTHCQLNNNRSFNTDKKGVGGGAITVTSGKIHLQDSCINGNQAHASFAAGVVALLADVTVDRCVIKNNSSRGPATVVGNLASNIRIKNSEIQENTAAALGGGITNFSTGGTGSIHVENTQVTRNTLTDEQTIQDIIQGFFTLIEAHNGIVKGQALLGEQHGLDVAGGRFVVESILPTIRAKAAQTEAALRIAFPLLIKSTKSTLICADSLVPKKSQSQAKTDEKKACTPIIPILADPFDAPGQIAGAGIATFLICPIRIVHSKIEENCAKQNKRTCSSGGGVFALNGAISLECSSLVSHNEVNSRGGGIFNGLTLCIDATSKIKQNRLASDSLDCPRQGVNIYNLRNVPTQKSALTSSFTESVSSALTDWNPPPLVCPEINRLGEKDQCVIL